MTGLKTALQCFFSQFGVPAYLIDDVPPDAKLPYITYSVSLSDFGGQTVQTAYLWCGKEAPYGNLWRTTKMDEIETAFPTGGLMLSVDGGYVILYRNSTDFLRDWQDPEDSNVIGARISYIAQHNHL